MILLQRMKGKLVLLLRLLRRWWVVVIVVLRTLRERLVEYLLRWMREYLDVLSARLHALHHHRQKVRR